MANFTLDRTGLIFFSFSLALFCWAVFDTQRFLRLLSFNRKTTFTHFALMAIKVPGTICILGAAWMILATLLRKH
jgi:hypothetical protein